MQIQTSNLSVISNVVSWGISNRHSVAFSHVFIAKKMSNSSQHTISVTQNIFSVSVFFCKFFYLKHPTSWHNNRNFSYLYEQTQSTHRHTQAFIIIIITCKCVIHALNLACAFVVTTILDTHLKELFLIIYSLHFYCSNSGKQRQLGSNALARWVTNGFASIRWQLFFLFFCF